MSRAVRMLLTGALGALGLGAMARPGARRRSGREIASRHDRGDHRDRVPGRRPVLVHDRQRQDLQARRRRRSQQAYSRPGASCSATSSSSAGGTSASRSARTAPSAARTERRRRLEPGRACRRPRHPTDETTATTAAQPLGDVDTRPLRRRRAARGSPRGGSQIWRSTRHEPRGVRHGLGRRQRRRRRRLQARPRDIDDMFLVAGQRRPATSSAKSFGAGVLHRRTTLGRPRGEKPARRGNGFEPTRRLAGDPAQPEPHVGGRAGRRRRLVRTSARATAGTRERDWAIAQPRPARPHRRRTTSTTPGGTVARGRRRRA